MLYSNYNVLTLPITAEGKYKIGDLYKPSSNSLKERKFDGLIIKNIDYVWGVRLHFDFYEWLENTPLKYPDVDDWVIYPRLPGDEIVNTD